MISEIMHFVEIVKNWIFGNFSYICAQIDPNMSS